MAKKKPPEISLDEAREILEPYRGRMGAYKQDLGEQGVRALHVLADGSPTAAIEYLGYAPTSVRNMGVEFEELGLPVQKRDGRLPAEPWRRFDDEAGIDEIREQYLGATSRVERPLDVEWKVKRGTEYAMLVPIADLHCGEKAMDYRRWLTWRDWIGENPDVRWLDHGDKWDLATKESPGRSLSRQAIPFDKAYDLLRDDMEPIKDQCIGIMTGNHEQRIARALALDWDPAARLAEDLGVPALGYECFVRYRLTDGKCRQTYDGYHHHGVGSGQTWGSVLNSAERLAKINRADWVVMAHRHQLASVPVTFREIAEDVEGRLEVGISKVRLICPGCFLKHEGGIYAVEKGYAPSALGAATIHLYLDRHAVHARA